MKTNYTKGEWVVNSRASRNVRCGNKTIANCSQGQDGEHEEEEKANAKLISAAPDLLEALQFLFEKVDWDKQRFSLRVHGHRITEQAINKATK